MYVTHTPCQMWLQHNKNTHAYERLAGLYDIAHGWAGRCTSRTYVLANDMMHIGHENCRTKYTQRWEVVFFNEVVAKLLDRTNRSRRCVELIDFVSLNHVPTSSHKGVGWIGADVRKIMVHAQVSKQAARRTLLSWRKLTSSWVTKICHKVENISYAHVSDQLHHNMQWRNTHNQNTSRSYQYRPASGKRGVDSNMKVVAPFARGP